MVTEKLIETVRASYDLAAASCPTRPEVREPHCPVCGKEIHTWDAPIVEYIETRRRTQILIHTGCVGKWGK